MFLFFFCFFIVGNFWIGISFSLRIWTVLMPLYLNVKAANVDFQNINLKPLIITSQSIFYFKCSSNDDEGIKINILWICSVRPCFFNKWLKFVEILQEVLILNSGPLVHACSNIRVVILKVTRGYIPTQTSISGCRCESILERIGKTDKL